MAPESTMSQAKNLPLAATPRKALTLFDASLFKPAVADAFRKLDPRVQARSPVMFVVYVGTKDLERTSKLNFVNEPVSVGIKLFKGLLQLEELVSDFRQLFMMFVCMYVCL